MIRWNVEGKNLSNSSSNEKLCQIFFKGKPVLSSSKFVLLTWHINHYDLCKKGFKNGDVPRIIKLVPFWKWPLLAENQFHFECVEFKKILYSFYNNFSFY